MKYPRRFSASLLLASLALSGCALTSGGDIQQTYVLPVPALDASKPTLALHLKVMPVDVASGLDTTRIALIENNVQINYLADSRWAEPLPQMLQFLWMQALSQSGLAASVSSDTDGTKADRLIYITATAFNAYRTTNNDIAVRIRYQAKIVTPLTHIVSSVEESTIEETAPSANMASVMQTFNEANTLATSKLLQKLSADLRK
jgi:ABC-type uncharacterized transport system auxiliary subunit